ncbi:MAG: GntR family transcriptional regulator [Maritimibacter sp.]|nr:GntR family transcriptional regulator [Maritimibacter sp.]
MSQANEPIKRRKLSDEVQERLLALIRSQKLKPGAPIPSERELMAEYQVGRPAIREAMQNLHRMGLIEIKHGERPRISEPSLQALVEPMALSMHHLLTHSSSTMENLKEARLLFEIQMVRIAATRRTDADVQLLREVLAKQESLRSEPEGFLQHDGLFHCQIAEISGNPLFASVSSAIFDWLAQFHVELVRHPGFEQLTLDEHAEILEAVAAQDADAAERAMSDHLTRANRLYRQDHAR